ncbi:hypothetical protein AB0K51_06185 [Kitasatospora sp. NPDC049285]|uniref:hypothetical protein n=1 Tax=Kitasatospora sp. NPDC049285 TaxID=3157096 RepID=UPI0034127CFD
MENVKARRRLPGRKTAAGRDLSPVALAAGLAGAWLVPLLTHLAGVDLLLLPLLVLAVASVLRIGGGLVDRLVAAGLVTAGSVMVFGLLFSVWPWGLAPVPTVGTMLTAVVLTAWLADRRPELPWRRLRGTDLVIAGVGAVVLYYLHGTIRGRSAADRLPYFLVSEDRMGHFSYFEGIRELGGYAFLHQDAARTYMMTPAEGVYPQGSHFLLAWIDALVRGGNDAGPVLGEMNRYFLYVLAANALLCAVVVWAARWVGGPRLRGWRAAAVVAVVGALMLSGLTVKLSLRGFDSELIGLLFLAAAMALLMRPAMGAAEFAAVSVAALVTVTYTYNLYGAFVGLALVVVCWVYRRRFAGRRRALLAVLLGGLAVAAIPSVVSVLGELDVAKTSNLPGPMASADRPLLVGGAFLVLLALLVPGNRRTGVARTLLLTLLGSGSVLLVFGLWQKATIGYYSYYFEKLAMAVLITAVIAFGTTGWLLQPLVRRRRDHLLLSVLATGAAFSLIAGIQWGFPSAEGIPEKKNSPTAFETGDLVAFAKGSSKVDDSQTSQVLARRDMKRIDQSRPVIALYSTYSFQNLRQTFLAQLLSKQAGDMVPLYEIYNVKMGGSPAPGEIDYQKSLTSLRKAISGLSEPPTVLVGDWTLTNRLKHDLGPSGVTVLYAPVDGTP